MPEYPMIRPLQASRLMTEVFGGYDHNLKIEDGRFYDTTNLSSSYYPLLANRAKRGTVSTLTAPQGLLAKDALAYVDGAVLYYNGAATGLNNLTALTSATSPKLTRSATEPAEPTAGDYWYNTTSKITKIYGTAWTECAYPSKQLVSMGAYLCIFPDKKYINTADLTDFGSMEATFVSVANADVSYAPCAADGTLYATPTLSATAPVSPANGDMWIDTSEAVHNLKQYSEGTGLWVDIPTVYTRITFTSQGSVPALFNEWDGVTISGCVHTDTGSGIAAQINALNGSKILYAVGGSADPAVADYIVIVGLIDAVFTQQAGSVTIARTVPSMDFVCECGNRLWGCKYGVVESANVNELYACVLGDFRNWSRYLGISTDSWTASVGSDGVWTGAVSYLGHPIFFKEDCLHKITISSSGAHAVSETVCRGVQRGSERSLVVVNEALYYKAPTDVCVYDGSLPMSVSAPLGDVRYYEASAGACGQKYSIAMRTSQGVWSLFTLDIARGIWLREDSLHALCFACVGTELYAVDADTLKLLALNGTTGTLETSVSWAAESGMQHYRYPDKKYVSRYNFRIGLAASATVTVYIEYDSSGTWISSGSMTASAAVTKTYTLPIRPRRCDHMRVKLTGTGDFKLYSIARILVQGSDN